MGTVQSILSQSWWSQNPHHELLKQAAAGVIYELQRLDDFRNNPMIIIGGLAMMKYGDQDRSTTDIDFLIVTGEGPQSLKARLLALPGTPFREKAWKLIYTHSENFEIFIDLHSHQDFPFVPCEARPIGQIRADDPPYISMTDLLTFKMFSCGLRSTILEKDKDAKDARLLLETLEKPLRLRGRQWSIIDRRMRDTINHSEKEKTWWMTNLEMSDDFDDA